MNKNENVIKKNHIYIQRAGCRGQILPSAVQTKSWTGSSGTLERLGAEDGYFTKVQGFCLTRILK